jgi:DnaK suppressor protein
MTGDEAGRHRARLRADRDRTVDQVAALGRDVVDVMQAADDVATDDEHDPEGHTIAWERQQLSALLQAARARLVELDAALERLDAGTYGLCETCGRDIEPQRLAALPATRHCVTCAR